MGNECILVVEDEADILELIRFNLLREGYRVTGATTGEEAIERVRATPFDLVLLDLMLPGIDGLEVCRTIKRDPDLQRVPVVMLTAKGEESDVVAGLELGADDYVVKPFSPRELIARIRAVRRRYQPDDHETGDRIAVHGLTVDKARRRVLLDGKELSLTAGEFAILHHLAGKPGWVFTRNQIIDAIKGENYAVTERSVDVQIVGLRKKLGDAGTYIETVRGVGYRFRE